MTKRCAGCTSERTGKETTLWKIDPPGAIKEDNSPAASLYARQCLNRWLQEAGKVCCYTLSFSI